MNRFEKETELVIHTTLSYGPRVMEMGCADVEKKGSCEVKKNRKRGGGFFGFFLSVGPGRWSSLLGSFLALWNDRVLRQAWIALLVLWWQGREGGT